MKYSGETLRSLRDGRSSGPSSLGGILIVDDDPEIRKFIRIILENSGYDVLEAEDGAQAITVIIGWENSIIVDTIIADLSLPNIDGCEAIAYFQKEFSNIPLIVLTGIKNLDLAITFMRRGANCYLVKPVDVEQLKVSVARAIGHRQLFLALAKERSPKGPPS